MAGGMADGREEGRWKSGGWTTAGVTSVAADGGHPRQSGSQAPAQSSDPIMSSLRVEVMARGSIFNF